MQSLSNRDMAFIMVVPLWAVSIGCVVGGGRATNCRLLCRRKRSNDRLLRPGVEAWETPDGLGCHGRVESILIVDL